jgi:hypothetical protein
LKSAQKSFQDPTSINKKLDVVKYACHLSYQLLGIINRRITVQARLKKKKIKAKRAGGRA